MFTSQGFCDSCTNWNIHLKIKVCFSCFVFGLMGQSEKCFVSLFQFAVVEKPDFFYFFFGNQEVLKDLEGFCNH